MSSPQIQASLQASSPPLASIAKKINPSAVEVVAVGRTVGASRTLEAALEPEHRVEVIREPDENCAECVKSLLKLLLPLLKLPKLLRRRHIVKT